jgi:hypothetical protein
MRLGHSRPHHARRRPASRNTGIGIITLIFLLAPQSVETFAKGIASTVF